MDAFSQLILRGSPSALNYAKSLLSAPTLINTGFIGRNKQGLPFAIALGAEEVSQQGNAQVSESVVITSNKKVNIADNISPSSWEWNLQGYISGEDILEPTNFFTPFVRLYTNLLKTAFKNGYILIYKDIDAAIYTQVVIKQLTIRTQPECRNKTPFSMTLKEINTLSVNENNQTLETSSAIPNPGGILGDAIDAGTTIAVTASTDILSIFL